MNKIVSLALLLLVATMIFSSVPIHAYSEPGLDSLVRIASDARGHIKLELAKINGVSEELVMLYEKGSSETDALIEAAEQGDVPASREHFMSAMKNFKKIGESIGKQKPTAEVALDESTNPSIGLNHVIDRMESYVTKLQAAAEKYDSEINFDELNQLIAQAKTNIEQGNSAEAIKIIDILKPQILVIYDLLKIEADQQKADRVRDFAEKHVQRLDNMITQAKSLGLKNETINELEKSRINLLSASDSDQIVKQVRIIISVKNQFDEVKVNRTQAQINQLESKINTLSKNEITDSAKLEQAKTMLNELRGLISEGNFDEYHQCDGLSV